LIKWLILENRRRPIKEEEDLPVVEEVVIEAVVIEEDVVEVDVVAVEEVEEEEPKKKEELGSQLPSWVVSFLIN
jgi:hypothetical protein